jgi:sugar lactone lactonase YvrE
MNFRLRVPLVYAGALGLIASLALAASAAAGPSPTVRSVTATPTAILPTEIALPDGFQPEGIAIGGLPFAFFGSLVDGDLFRVSLLTGRGEVFSQGPGTPSVGLKVDQRGRLFVAGGPGGNARVVNAITGKVLASYSFATAPTFVNDVVLTPDAAWFTDSQSPFLYKVPLGHFGELPAPGAVVAVPLTGDYVQQPGFNANGITRTPDGKALLIVQSNTGLLLRVDPATGVSTTVDLGGQLLTNGDGLLLEGRTLYAVQNQQNQIAVVRLNPAGTAGQVTRTITDPRFDIPTTIASFGNRLYATNARFTTPPTPTTPYTAVAVSKS